MSTSFKTELAEIMTLLKGLQKDVKEIKAQTAMSTENISNIYQTSSDLSRKFDEMVNVTGIKTPTGTKNETKKTSGKKETKARPKSKAVKSKPIVKKKKLHGNIMTYFRSKFLADQTYFHSVMDPKETEELFEEHEKDLKAKKGDKKLKAQVGFLYKAISANKPKMNSLRNMMDKENSDHLKAQGVEAVKDETDGDEGDDDSDSDSDNDE